MLVWKMVQANRKSRKWMLKMVQAYRKSRKCGCGRWCRPTGSPERVDVEDGAGQQEAQKLWVWKMKSKRRLYVRSQDTAYLQEYASCLVISANTQYYCSILVLTHNQHPK